MENSYVRVVGRVAGGKVIEFENTEDVYDIVGVPRDEAGSDGFTGGKYVLRVR